MKTLATARALEKVFANRTLTAHAEKRTVKTFPHGDRSAHVVLNLSVSRKILASRSFSSFNYFDDGLRHTESSGTPAQHVSKFFDTGMLFLEGPEHHALKQAVLRILDQCGTRIEESEPRLRRFFSKRKEGITNPWQFSKLFTRMSVTLVIGSLINLPLLQASRLFRDRENVFYYYFHAIRHRKMNAVLARLSGAAPPRNSDIHDRAAYILVQSLIMMGYDPLVGSLCGSLVEKNGNLQTGPWQYCPTSFVSRLCVEGTSIEDFRFDNGDICYVSLLPALGESGSTFPFGLGAHACVGKRFSLLLLRTAENVVRDVFPDGFERTSEVCADGAFLGFRTPPQDP